VLARNLTDVLTGCALCMHELPLHQRSRDIHECGPFSIVSVCTDESLKHAQKGAAAKRIDWSCLFDGENGPIAQEWNVLTSPTIYLLDQSGVVVAKNIHGERLDRKIDDLLQRAK
jgi:hypothetical protein